MRQTVKLSPGGRVAVVVSAMALLASACSSGNGRADDNADESVIDATTYEEVALRLDEGSEATVEVFFGFPVKTLFDFYPSDISCEFTTAEASSLPMPKYISIESRGGRDLTPIASYTVRGSAATELVCEDHTGRDIDLAVIVTR